MKRQISKSILVLIMCFFALVAIFPILMMLMNSFKTGAELAANAWGLPENWSLTNYKNLLTYSSGQLDSEYGIMTRVGLHCAPNAHKTLGTYPAGTIRLSFGPENTQEELDAAIYGLKKILNL